MPKLIDPIKPKPKKRPLTVQVTDEEREQLRRIAVQRGVSMAHAARSLLLWNLERYEENFLDESNPS